MFYLASPFDVGRFVQKYKCTWAVLALICHIELFIQAHYIHSIEPNDHASALYKDVFSITGKRNLSMRFWMKSNGAVRT
jgi:hypothetical protein